MKKSSHTHLPVHRSGDNLGTNGCFPEDKLCTSCGWGKSSRNFPETPCAPCGNRRRTTPTPSTTGGPLGGNFDGGTQRETAAHRRGPTRISATPRTIGGRGTRPFGAGDRGSDLLGGGSPVRVGGQPQTGAAARRTRTAAADAIGGPRDCALGCGTPAQRAGDRERDGGPTDVRQHGRRSARQGQPDRRTGGRAAGPSISYIEGPAPVSGCPTGLGGPGSDTARSPSHRGSARGAPRLPA